MKTLHLIAAFVLLSLLSCNDGQTQQKTLEELQADSAALAANAPPADTTGFIGQWKCGYSEYAYNFTIQLQITKSINSSCPGYNCAWTRKDQFGGQKKTYTWCAKCDETNMLIGIANLEIDNTKISIYKEDDQALTAIIEYPGQPQARNLTFTK